MHWEHKTPAIRILTKSAQEGRQLFLDPDFTEETEAEFRTLGEQGWELVSVMPMSRAALFGSAATRTGLAFSKRQKDDT
jgi:hypothetical protein